MEQLAHKQIPLYAGKSPEGQMFTYFGGARRDVGPAREVPPPCFAHRRCGGLQPSRLVGDSGQHLCWTGFQAPFCSSEEALQEWNEDNRDRIVGLAYSTPALTLAHGEMYQKDD